MAWYSAKPLNRSSGLVDWTTFGGLAGSAENDEGRGQDDQRTKHRRP